MRLDLLLALRLLPQDPFLTATIVFILAMGIGANTAAFGIVDADLLTYLSAGGLLLWIGVAASVRPAWRTATQDALGHDLPTKSSAVGKRHLATVIAILSVLTGCSARYLVVPSNPHYLLRAPDGQTRTFPDTTANLSNALDGWIDLRTGLTLQLARAYFNPPESRRLQDYIGLETARFAFQGGSLRQVLYQPLASGPSSQPSIDSTIPADQLAFRYHRLFFQVVLDKEAGPARAVLLSGDSQPAIVSVGEGLLSGMGCRGTAPADVRCLVIPDGTAASVLFDVLVNGKSLTVAWGNTVAGTVGKARPVKLWRKHRNRIVPVELDAADSEALRLPLLPGDVLVFGR